MSPRTVLLVCGPLAALGLAGTVHGTVRIARARRELAALSASSAFEGRAFAETLKGTHVERQLELLTERRAIARELAAARRDRLLGVSLIVAAVVSWLGLRTLRRMAKENDEDRRHWTAERKIDWKGP